MNPPQPKPVPIVSAVEVRTPARFHVGMFSFGDPRVRSFGGTGLMLDGPGVTLRIDRSATFSAAGPLADRAVGFARDCCRAWHLPADIACHVEVTGAPRSHVGLGSGTQLALAVAAGVETLFVTGRSGGSGVGGERRFSSDDAFRLAGGVARGRRSSVGIHGFASGGLLVEAGRLDTGKTGIETIAGSAMAGSPLIARIALPPGWRGVLAIERNTAGLHGEAEREAFRALPPVERGVTAELVRIAVMEMIPAAAEGRFAEFAAAFQAYGRLAGVPFELASRRLPFHGTILRLIDRFAALGVDGAAQSSWGPAVLGCCESETVARGVVAALAREGWDRSHDIGVVGFNVRGAVLRPLG